MKAGNVRLATASFPKHLGVKPALDVVLANYDLLVFFLSDGSEFSFVRRRLDGVGDD